MEKIPEWLDNVALVNAYAPKGANGPLIEIKRIEGQIRRGDVSYLAAKKASELLGRSGLQLPRVREPKESYDVPYDLFPETQTDHQSTLPGPAGRAVRTPAGKAKAGRSLDLQPTATVSLRPDPAMPGVYHVSSQSAGRLLDLQTKMAPAISHSGGVQFSKHNDISTGHRKVLTVENVDTKKASELLGRSELQLPRVPSLNTDPLKILTKKTGRLSARRTGHWHSGCGAFVRHPVQPGASRQPAKAVRYMVSHQGETE